ncbi:MAG: dynamin family protein [Alicyclobacillus herbarius]|uniref:dynamin family protein n=1 Tax=Alicyclobacillus herbarius TaxID=122960 RepID=UPI002354B93A|nr:dynamin family protein [Alicyclobacillus herbarius]MCL6632180.1 dynamin family protein [Alicyclobacillus herbarius]
MTIGMQRLRRHIAAAGDVATAEKLAQLIQRAESPQHTVVAFVGLFSAGKSSLINALTGSQRMATGAVPTTAEVTSALLPGTDGRVRLLDTPGIDSTDEAHQRATQSALYQADVVCLVMDYQHVESDANLEWAYQFSGTGKRLVLIVNQIDKHVEWEIPFETFAERIESTFADWELHYERLFFVTSRQHERNQMPELMEWLRGLAAAASPAQLTDRAGELIAEHLDWKYGFKQRQLNDQVRACLGLPDSVTVETDVDVAGKREDAMHHLSTLKAEVEGQEQALCDAFATFLSQVLREIELAQIAPYETTEKGRLFVESMRPDFRVGWLRSAERTEKERQQRLTAFRAELAERTEKYMQWPVIRLLREFASGQEGVNEVLLQGVDELSVRIEDGWLRQMVREGALISDSYPYQYVKDVVAALKADFRAQVKSLLERWQEAARERLKVRLADVLDRCQQIEADITVLNAWLELRAQRFAEEQQLQDLLTTSDDADEGLTLATPRGVQPSPAMSGVGGQTE